MLKLQGITKNYFIGDNVVQALKGVNINFRKNEFVSILGASGCGKTTLLNIVGGLDRYTNGDLIIEGRSTKNFTSKDWDSYRNHSIGFIFQSYNLIPHQTVLSNVELALTLSGVSKEERKKKAIAALEKVGLGDQLDKKPNQMSGGQMQRVAIARAIVNDPEIILADEPTGALDTQTSVQVMDILKEIAKDRLVIMVTHNPELAEKYSTRIVRLLDGLVIGDSNPYEGETYNKSEDDLAKDSEKTKHTSMSFFTALSLSLNNLFTKKARTILTAFAGSIGIIGIALILSLSAGFNAYIAKVEKETLSTYPVTIDSQTMDLEALMNGILGDGEKKDYDDSMLNRDDQLGNMFDTLMGGVKDNDLKSFKKHIEDNYSTLENDVSAIKYTYNSSFYVYKKTETNDYQKLIPFDLPVLKQMLDYMQQPGEPKPSETVDNLLGNVVVWQEMLDSKKLLESQYEVLSGDWPTKFNDVVLVVDENNVISDYTLYALGLIEEKDMLSSMNPGGEQTEQKKKYNYDDIVGLKYKLLTDSDYYKKNGTLYDYIGDDKNLVNEAASSGLDINVSGIIKIKDGVRVGSISGSVGYTHDLVEYIVQHNNQSEVLNAQKANDDIYVVNGQSFADLAEAAKTDSSIKVTSKQAALFQMGEADLDDPSSISIYPSSFEGKERIVKFINDYNNSVGEEQKITYTDFIAMMMSSITTIVNAITYVLIAFVSISLVVSSIMIGIITYISVLERIKEIGVIRSIGGSKKDVFTVFCAEALIIGFVSGVLGILVTLVLNIPINIIINMLANIKGVAKLPILGAFALIFISMLLTFVAGLIPSSVASKKDPVIALRSE